MYALIFARERERERGHSQHTARVTLISLKDSIMCDQPEQDFPSTFLDSGEIVRKVTGFFGNLDEKAYLKLLDPKAATNLQVIIIRTYPIWLLRFRETLERRISLSLSHPASIMVSRKPLIKL